MEIPASYLVEFIQWLLYGFDVWLETENAIELYPPLIISCTTICVSIMVGAFFQMFTSALGALFGMQRGRRR